jgi:hypothetical protein
MFAALRKGVGFHIAFAMAAFGVFALVAPSLAVAFAPAEHAAHCLTQSDHAMGHERVDRAADHEHDPGDLDKAKHSHPGDKHRSQCCGLFCVTAIVPEIRQFANPPLEHPQLSSLIVPRFDRRLPVLLFRPPISPLSL